MPTKELKSLLLSASPSAFSTMATFLGSNQRRWQNARNRSLFVFPNTFRNNGGFMAQIYIFKKANKQIPVPKQMPPKDFQVFRAANDKANTRTLMWRTKWVIGGRHGYSRPPLVCSHGHARSQEPGQNPETSRKTRNSLSEKQPRFSDKPKSQFSDSIITGYRFPRQSVRSKWIFLPIS